MTLPIHAFRDYKVLYFLVAFCLFHATATAQRNKVLLKAGTVTLESAPAALEHFSASQKEGQEQLVLVRLKQHPDEKLQNELQNAGLMLQDRVESGVYSAILKAPFSSDRLVSNIEFITLFRPEWKMESELWLQQGEKNTNLIVSFASGTSRASIDSVLLSAGATIISDKFSALNAFEVAISANRMVLLAAHTSVRYLSRKAENVLLNADQRALSGVDMAELPVALGGNGLNGEGVTIGIGDNSPALGHIDTKDRNINFNPAPLTAHGSHTTGTAGGAGIIDPRARGMAPRAQLLSHLYNLVWAETGNMLQGYNMTLSNNSYAAVVGDCSAAGIYDIYSRIIDQLAVDYPTVLHVFAAGNDGNNTCSPYPHAYGTVNGSYQPAKNNLVVGNVQKDLNVFFESSRGPVRDGRVKPEIMAIGTDLFSDLPDNNYVAATGTSMASPGATGALALITQRYKQLNANVNPSGAMLKVLAINGATDVGAPGPDYSYGFGILNLYRSIEMLQNNRVFGNAVANAGVQIHAATVPANTAQLKVTLGWIDVPGNPMSPTALVNDLDVEVVTPAGTTRRPLILNPSNPSANATEAADHLNNIEQIVIDNPVAGNYVIRVLGSSVTGTVQPYTVGYNVLANGIRISNPVSGSAVKAGNSLNVYWEAYGGSGNFKLEYSTDNGAAWTLVSDSIAAGRRQFSWSVPSISTAQARIRISRTSNSQTATSEQFTISAQPLVALSTVQCPGYMAMHWSPVANATGYQILQKKGIDLVPVDTVTGDTIYTLKGLLLDSTYYAAVRPIIGGTLGYRSLAISRKPNNGTCAGAISNNDLMIERIVAPVSGRIGTSSQLPPNQNIGLWIRNLDDVPCNNFQLVYKLDNNPWQANTMIFPIPANTALLVAMPGNLNLSAPGVHTLRMAIRNLAATDPVSANDTVVKVVRQLLNPLVTLPFNDGFESVAQQMVTTDTMGFSADERWDYTRSTEFGRLRTNLSQGVVIAGSRSLSMDATLANGGTLNLATGNFNLSNYSTGTSEVRLEFKYRLHGIPKFDTGNQVWVRGSDMGVWRPLFRYNEDSASGIILTSGSLSLNDALFQASPVQDFTSSTQIRFGQHDTSVIAGADYGNGVTIDDFKLYTVVNDMQLLAIDTPLTAACNLSAMVPLRVKVYNSVSQQQNNVQLYYRLDGGATVNASLPLIFGKDTVLFTFPQSINASTPGLHTLDVWLSATGDSYHLNDSILHYSFRNQPLVTTFPYIQNFEGNEGNWYTEGRNNSWQYGTPASPKIHKAASGTKAWKTNLTGNYNDFETSYLYSPCFDLTGMATPMLSFSTAQDIENCGTVLCDQAWVEWSTNGTNWTKLGAVGQGTNWYDSTSYQAWTQQDNTRWHVASIPLAATTQPIRLRFVFNSDPGANREGLAVDDIHIFDRLKRIYDGATTAPVPATVSGTAFTDFLSSDKYLARLQPANQNLGNTEVTMYSHSYIVADSGQQYYLPRSFVVKSVNSFTDSVTARFFVLDTEVVRLVNATGCATCSKVEDVYELGITQYEGSFENGSLADNADGVYTYQPYSRIKWVPYDRGYYAEAKMNSFSEVWFNDGGPNNSAPLRIVPAIRNQSLAVFPNPTTNGRITLAWTSDPGSRLQVAVTDMMGRLIQRTELRARQWNNEQELDLGAQAKGVYFLRVTNGAQTFVEKVVVR